jgi:hypothetical protein
MDTVSDTNCPYCEAKRNQQTHTMQWQCGTHRNPEDEYFTRSRLCVERRAHNNTKRERDQWRECAKGLADRLRLRGSLSGLFAAEEVELAEFERLKDDSK